MIEDLVRKIMFLARAQRSREYPVVAGTGVDRAGDMQQLLAESPFQLAPELIGSAQEWDVRWILIVGETDDAVDAVRRPHRMRDVESLKAEHARSAPCQLVAGGAPHRSNTHHNDIERLIRHGNLFRSDIGFTRGKRHLVKVCRFARLEQPIPGVEHGLGKEIEFQEYLPRE